MDVTDLQVLRSLGVHPFLGAPRGPDVLKPAYVARTVGISLDSAKGRIRRMEEAGIIRGYDLLPNLAHLGVDQAVYHFTTAAADKPRALAAVAAVDGVTEIMDFVGTGFDVTVCSAHPSELGRRVDLIASVANAAVVERYAQPPRPPVSRALTPLDWRIIQALRRRARRDPAQVAEEIGVSRRTVVRRLHSMTQDGSADLYALIDPGLFPQVTPTCLVCRYEGTHDLPRVSEVLDAVADHILFSWIPPKEAPGTYRLAAFARSMQEAERLRLRVLGVPGVTSAEAQFPSGKTWNTPWIDEAIGARVGTV